MPRTTPEAIAIKKTGNASTKAMTFHRAPYIAERSPKLFQLGR
jgi:hypothetical protein